MALPYERGALLQPFHNSPHLFAVMNDECAAGMCLLIMVSTIKDGRFHDPACNLNVGDHDFIKHPSYMVYATAQTPAARHVRNLVARGYYTARADFGGPVFSRIAAGIFISDETRGVIRNYADAVGLD